MTSDTVDVCVIGAGVMGAATAWALGRAGRDAVVLEQFDPGHDRGSSHGATRIFRFSYDDPFYVAMAQRTLPAWRELERIAGEPLLAMTGGVDFGPPDDLSSSAAALRTCGAAADIIDAAEVRARFPGVAIRDTALYSPDTGVLAASRCVAAMLAASSVPVRSGERVARIEADGDGWVVGLSSGGAVRARRVIATAGAWTQPLLDRPLPLAVSREQIFYFAGGDGLPVVIDRGELFRYFLPPAHGAPGAKAGEHGTGERTTADGRSFAIDPEGEARICDWVDATFPALDASPVAAETCLYTLTPDEDFLIGRDGGLVYASACSGHGFKFAPLIGETLAALAYGDGPPIDVERFSPARFGA